MPATPVNEWKKAESSDFSVDLKVPSGNTARCRRPGLQTFIKIGIIPNSLLAIVTKNIDAAKKGSDPEDSVDGLVTGMMEDPAQLAQMLQLVDDITIFCVIEPQVQKVPDDPMQRTDDALYVDQIDLNDKMFIFQWAVGGTSNLDEFLGESQQALGNLQPQSEFAHPSL